MSFFKKMVDKIEDLVGDDDKKKDEKHKEDNHKEDKHDGILSPPHDCPPNLTTFTTGTKDLSSHDQHPPYDQHQYNQQPQYGQHQSYGGPPPSHAPTTTAGPTLPPGWIAQWDQNSQRWYYLEQATGRTQWDLPQPSHAGYPPPQAPHSSFAPGPPMGGHGYDSHGQHGAQGGYYSQETKNVYEDSHGGSHKDIVEKKEKKEK
ncbi:MAG: hypothetical protein LQ337_006464, partial [Flavoplaca oasis]